MHMKMQNHLLLFHMHFFTIASYLCSIRNVAVDND